ncbi:hypothetical protein KAR91_78420 [Candidatus Pacearchaeota archaeon]|nr:hypothetical protein [Candidatus Pacearchaeota archaeon]
MNKKTLIDRLKNAVGGRLHSWVMRRRERIKERKAAAKRYAKWLKHEADWKKKGDTRCDYYKLVDKCCITQIDLEIANPGRCENPNHTQGSKPQQYA